MSRFIGDDLFGTGGKPHLSAAAFDGVAHGLDYFRQTVGAYMWMCVCQYVGLCAVLAENP